MSSRAPLSSASMSTLTLSVSISAMASPAVTGSPTFLRHFRTLPSVMASPIFGMITSATGLPSRGVQRFLHGPDDVVFVRDGQQFEVAGVGHRRVGARDPLDRGVPLLEGLPVG